MSTRIRQHIRSNVYGIVAVFIALGGSAIAANGPLPGQNKVGSADIINGEVKSVDVGAGQIGASDVDTGVIQRRVGGECTAGQAIRAVDSAGEVVCESIGGSAPTGPAGGALAGTYPDPSIAAGVVGTAEVAANSLTTSNINESTLFNDDSLTAADLAPDAVAGSEIADDAVTGSKIETDAVGTTEVAVNSLTTSDIQEQTLFNDNSLAAADLALDSVAGSEIAADAVTDSEIAADAVTDSEIAADAVTGSEILNNSVTGSDVNEGALGQVPQASNALLAGNAQLLDGIDSTELLIARSDTADETECTGTLPGGLETCADVTVTLPHDARVFVLGTGVWEPLTGTSSAICAFHVDQAAVGPTTEVGGHPDTEFNINYAFIPVALQMTTGVLPAGAHEFEFKCRTTITDRNDIDHAYISTLVLGSG